MRSKPPHRRCLPRQTRIGKPLPESHQRHGACRNNKQKRIRWLYIPQVCDKHGVSVVNFYNWQKVFFENGAAAFDRKPNSANVKRQQDANLAKIEVLETKLQQKNEVIAELLQEHVQLKKANGAP